MGRRQGFFQARKVRDGWPSYGSRLKNPEHCIYNQSEKHKVDPVHEKVDEIQNQNRVHDAIQDEIGPRLPGQSYQQEAMCGGGHDGEWSA